MKKQSNTDHEFQQLDQNIVWNGERQEMLKQKIMKDVGKMDKEKSFRNVFLYASSIAVFLFIIFIGYNLIIENEIETVQEEAKDHEQVVTNDIEDKTDYVSVDEVSLLQYYGAYDEEGHYDTIAMSDTNAMYFIPAMIEGANKDLLAKINFSTSTVINEEFNQKYELRTARSDIPLQNVTLENNHLHMYFDKEDLNNLRGSTGIGMGLFSIHTFAKNYSDDVEYYTAYGDGVPFDHFGEDFDIINIKVNDQVTLLPINTGKGIFLREHFEQFADFDEFFEKFFALHERPDYDYSLDLGMFSLERYEKGENEILIFLNGDLTYEGHNLDQESLKLLLAQGIGANIRYNQHWFDQPMDKAKIMLEGVTIFDGSLKSIRYNVIDIDL